MGGSSPQSGSVATATEWKPARTNAVASVIVAENDRPTGSEEQMQDSSLVLLFGGGGRECAERGDCATTNRRCSVDWKFLTVRAKPFEAVQVGPNAWVRVVQITGGGVRLQFAAPPDVVILRDVVVSPDADRPVWPERKAGEAVGG
jgi:hypothetical protein